MSTESIELVKVDPLEREIQYEAFHSRELITLTAKMVIKFLCRPTKQGKVCSLDQAVRFCMLCKARGLNPWEGDAFLVGYDTANGPEFSLITAHQAFLKRAEVHPDFQGMDSGVIVQTADGKLEEHDGDYYDDTEKLKGAWAKIFLKNRPEHPVYKRLRLDAFNKGFGRWKEDTGGMIVKCAEADALRSAFPNTIGGLYLEQPMNGDESGQQQLPENSAVAALEAQVLEQTGTQTSTPLEAELVESKKVVDAKKKEKAAKETAPKEEKKTVVEEPTVVDIAKEAAAKVEAKPETSEAKAEPKQEEPAPISEDEIKHKPLPEDIPAGKTLRGVTFPAQLTIADGYDGYTKAERDKADAEAQRIGINLKIFVQKRLGADVDELNAVAMGRLLELLKAVS